MIKKVATAIARYYGHPGPDGFEDVAIAAIRAMADPTPEMLDRMEEMYMPFGEMAAAWDGAISAMLETSLQPTTENKENDNG